MSDWIITVVCTDRGQHKRTRLADVRRVTEPEGEIRRSMTGSAGMRSWQPPGLDKNPNYAPIPEASRSSYVFDCPRCSRHLSIDQKRWWDALKVVVVQTDATEIDISVLPF